MSPLTGWPANSTATAEGGVATAPFTLWSSSSAMAWVVSASVAATPAALWMVPLFRVRALPPMLMPPASTSAGCTTYSNVSVLVPLPFAYAACSVSAPMPSASCGAPVTVTATWNATCTSMVSPAP